MFLYRDEDVVVINKPAGLLVHRGWARERVVAMTLVRDEVGSFVFPVHRLDRSASGALVLALTRDSARAMCRMFSERMVQKRYLALVRGIVPEEGVIDYDIPKGQDRKGPKVSARTRYNRVHTFERYSVVDVRPETGRLHQIRRHFKHISHPLVGDVGYGKGEHNRLFRERFGFHRMALHAVEIAFPHPRTGVLVRVMAPLPPEMADLWKAIGSPLPCPSDDGACEEGNAPLSEPL